MKIICFVIMLLSSFLLASCDNDSTNEDTAQNANNTTNISGEELVQNTDDNTTIQRRRILYRDYINQYNPSSVNENTEDVEMIEKNEDLPNDPIAQEPIDEKIYDPNMLATYSTSLLSSSDERVNNLQIVCDRLNNFILNPNETFSYNDVTGPFGPDDGFEEATILLSDGTKTEGYGGGVCQLSSTLYNVVKNIDNVEITERHHHSAPVAYVPEGEDATVSLQSGLDFKFTNKNNFPIRFEATCENWEVSVWAYREV